MDTELISPRLLSGFRDYSPGSVRIREQMMAKIARVFELFGFDPLDTSTVEFLEILTGRMPGWDRSGIYLIESSLEGAPSKADQDLYWTQRVALRFDLTVSLARYVATHLESLPRPFKRYQVGKVYRAEKAQEGRYREFIQFDADTMFAPDVIADAEIIAIMAETMRALDVANFIVKVNNRKIVEGLPELLKFDRRNLDPLLRTLDKRDKISAEEMASELMRPLNEDGLGLSPDQVNTLSRFTGLGGTFAERMADCARIFKGIAISEQGIGELSRVGDYLQALGISHDAWEVDFSVVRGLAYYTGPVFETVLTDLPKIGSVFSGGRFDNLVSRFSSAKVAGTGASVGVDRLLTALLALNKVKDVATGASCLMLQLEIDPAPVLAAATELRKAGINVMIYTGSEMSFKAQLNRAIKFGIPIIVILGGNELRDGTITVKNTITRDQNTIPRDQLVSFVEGQLRLLTK